MDMKFVKKYYLIKTIANRFCDVTELFTGFGKCSRSRRFDFWQHHRLAERQHTSNVFVELQNTNANVQTITITTIAFIYSDKMLFFNF